MTQITYQNPNIRFRQGLRYHGTWEHDCWIDGKQHKLVVGDNSYDGRREYFSGLSDEEFVRDVVGRRDTICFTDNNVVPDELVVAFNEWRRVVHVERVLRLTSQPERYGVIHPNDPSLLPFPTVVPVVYRQGAGWIRTGLKKNFQ